MTNTYVFINAVLITPITPDVYYVLMHILQKTNSHLGINGKNYTNMSSVTFLEAEMVIFHKCMYFNINDNTSKQTKQRNIK